MNVKLAIKEYFLRNNLCEASVAAASMSGYLEELQHFGSVIVDHLLNSLVLPKVLLGDPVC